MRAMRTYTIVVEPEETGGFMVSVPALPGCFTQGRSLEECRERAAEAIAVHIAGTRGGRGADPRRGGHAPAPEGHRRRLSGCRGSRRGSGRTPSRRPRGPLSPPGRWDGCLPLWYGQLTIGLVDKDQAGGARDG